MSVPRKIFSKIDKEQMTMTKVLIEQGSDLIQSRVLKFG